MSKIDIDKLYVSLLKKHGNISREWKEALAEQGLRFNGEDFVEIDPNIIGKNYVLGVGTWHMCIKDYGSLEAGHLYKSYNNTFLEANWNTAVCVNNLNYDEYFRPATEVEIIANNLSTTGSKEIDPDIQKVVNDHFYEMLDDEEQKPHILSDVVKEINAVDILLDGIDVDVMVENYYKSIKRYSYSDGFVEIKCRTYRQGLEDMLQAIRDNNKKG